MVMQTADPLISQESKNSQNDDFQPSSDDEKKVDEVPRQESKWKDQEKEYNDNSTNYVNAAGIMELMMLVQDEDDGAEADMNNLDT
nr:hypothetical protein [Tanacetum cinerariifolium]